MKNKFEKMNNIDINELINYLYNDNILKSRMKKIYMFYTSNQIIIELLEPKNYYNKFIERTLEKFGYIKNMYFIKNDGSCGNELKIIL